NLVEAVGKNGTIVQVGLYGQPIQVDMDKVLKKEIRLDVSYATNYSTWARLMKLLSLDQLILDPLLGTKYELKNWQTAFERAASGDDMKVIIVPEQI
ncbi:MAG TPA: hypothetical protein GX717_02265, partial [Clostridiaceae bacterium]|nr:hypothetical protein [Clostridiaceae bacterium]